MTGMEKLKSAVRASSDLSKQLEDQRETTFKVEKKLAKANSRKAEILAAEGEDAARRLLDGDDVAPPNKERKEELRKIAKDLEGLIPAVELSKNREEALRQKRNEIDQSISNAALACASEITHSAADAIKAALESVAPQLALLCAANKILERYTPVPADYANFPDEFSGEFVARNFLKGLTFFVRPESLAEARFDETVNEATAAVLKKLEINQ